MSRLSKPTRDALRAAFTSGLWAFLGTFGTSALGWLTDLTRWATQDGGAVVFPDPTLLVKAAVAAVVAGVTIVVAGVIRLAQAHGWIGGSPPTYPTT